MNEQTALQVAQQMANDNQKDYVVIKCNLGLCQILSYENFKLSTKKNYFKKIVPTI